MFTMPEISHDAVEAARELRELREDRKRFEWLGAIGTSGRFPDFSGGFYVRDVYGIVLGEGVSLRAAVDDAMAKEPKCASL